MAALAERPQGIRSTPALPPPSHSRRSRHWARRGTLGRRTRWRPTGRLLPQGQSAAQPKTSASSLCSIDSEATSPCDCAPAETMNVSNRSPVDRSLLALRSRRRWSPPACDETSRRHHTLALLRARPRHIRARKWETIVARRFSPCWAMIAQPGRAVSGKITSPRQFDRGEPARRWGARAQKRDEPNNIRSRRHELPASLGSSGCAPDEPVANAGSDRSTS